MSTYQRTGPLFYDLQAVILSSNLLRKYDAIFQALDLSDLPDRPKKLGNQGYSRHAMLRAFIVKHLERITSVPQLIDYIDGNPALAEMCGFEPGLLPHNSQFYRFLEETPNSTIQNIMHKTVKKLIDQGQLSDQILMMDSKPIMAATKQNNPKNPNRKLNKTFGPPKRNPQATLGYYSYQQISDGAGTQKKFTYFWGYRTHVIINEQGVPLVEITLPNNRTDAQVARKLIKRLKRVYGTLRNKVIIGDKAYDVKELYELIVTKMKAQAFIPINPRNQKQRSDEEFNQNGIPVCPAGLTMKSCGLCNEEHRRRIKYRCPIKADQNIREKLGDKCPIDDPHFKTYGCTRYIDITDDARARVPRDSELFKKTYKKRQAVEQYFARLGDRTVEQTRHYALRSVQNQMTIAHLSLALVAAAAIALGKPENLRCYRTFAKAVG